MKPPASDEFVFEAGKTALPAFSYKLRADVPKGYRCSECKAEGVKLWRHYNTFLEHQRFYCVVCACKAAALDPNAVGDDGRHEHALLNGRRSNELGGLVPAIPTEDGETFWGYTSTPPAGWDWWVAVPTRVPF